MNVVGVVQVRMGSSRLPAKVMAEIQGKPMAWHIVNRLRQAKSLSNVVIAVPDTEPNGPIREMAEAEEISYFAGSETDLVDRVYQTALKFGADAIVRVTGDCPLTDPDVVDQVVKAYVDRAGDLDYVSNIRPATFPHGLDTEVYPTSTLHRLWTEIGDPLYREWFPVYLWDRESEFRTRNIEHSEDLSHLRWTVDYAEDLEFVREVYHRLDHRAAFRMADVLNLLEAEPQLAEINMGHDRKEGYLQ